MLWGICSSHLLPPAHKKSLLEVLPSAFISISLWAPIMQINSQLYKPYVNGKIQACPDEITLINLINSALIIRTVSEAPPALVSWDPFNSAGWDVSTSAGIWEIFVCCVNNCSAAFPKIFLAQLYGGPKGQNTTTNHKIPTNIKIQGQFVVWLSWRKLYLLDSCCSGFVPSWFDALIGSRFG